MTVKQSKQAQASVIARHRYLEVLHQFTMSQASMTSVDDICWNIAKTAIGDLGFVDCVVYLISADGEQLIQRATHGDKNPTEREILDPISIPIGAGIVGTVAKTGTLELINDTRADERYILDDSFRCSELAVPILHEGRVVGVLDSEHPDPHFFSDEDVKLFMTIAALASTRLDTALALERLERQAVELDTARRAAESASNAKSRFIASVSHDMRTPLTAIMGYAQLLMDDVGSERQRNEWQQAIVSNSEYMTGMVGNVLDMATIESGRLSLSLEQIDVTAWLANVKSLVGDRASRKGLALDVIADSNAPKIWISDRSKLNEIVMNLLTNAIKYTLKGRVTLHIAQAVDKTASLFVLRVTDTGIGIAKDMLDQVYEPFTRVHDEQQFAAIEGAGLGLSVVKMFVDALQGQITLTSTLGGGTTVEVRIPMIAEDLGTSQPALLRPPQIDMGPGATHSTPVAALSGATIVVCEDSDTVASLIKIVLEREGATVHTATNGQEGVALIESAPAAVDLLVTDIQMPVMNGHEVSRHLRKIGWRGPIVALTAFAAVEDERRCLEAGCTDYLTKPIDVKVFPTVIAQHLIPKKDHSV
ncbi:response regulator [Luminiphilus sp.]|nr:response regulator [Luminiphilus sp.]MDB2511398.1 response regulator [Luminiphilus sp.]